MVELCSKRHRMSIHNLFFLCKITTKETNDEDDRRLPRFPSYLQLLTEIGHFPVTVKKPSWLFCQHFFLLDMLDMQILIRYVYVYHSQIDPEHAVKFVWSINGEKTDSVSNFDLRTRGLRGAV